MVLRNSWNPIFFFFIIIGKTVTETLTRFDFTGLDSFSASKLITVMKNMTTQRNKTIVCSIHQPNEQIFDLFKHVILLRQGEIAFSGTAADALVFFKK